MSKNGILKEREDQVMRAGDAGKIACERQSVAGSVSQRACVFCGSRVVLYPIADALHLVHGPAGCAAFTWDIRGSLSSGPELHRKSFTTDLKEPDIIFGGEKKLKQAILYLSGKYKPSAVFVYATCIIGVIGDDVDQICKDAEKEIGVPVISVHSEGFKGIKKDGYKAACEALLKLIGTGETKGISPKSINILGDFNLAGELWTIKEYYERMGVQVVSALTGDGRVAEIRKAHGAALNVVQCSGSMMHLAVKMKELYGIPFVRVSYFGIEDMAKALYDVADFFKDREMIQRTESLVSKEIGTLLPELETIRRSLEGKKAAIYVGGAFKAKSLVKALKLLGIRTAVVGSQTGNKDDYSELKSLCEEDTIILDDATSLELVSFVKEKGVHLFIGGVKERPIAYKLGVGFCDHNHERKIPLAGFSGMLNFAREVHASIMSPVWELIKERGRGI